MGGLEIKIFISEFQKILENNEEIDEWITVEKWHKNICEIEKNNCKSIIKSFEGI